MQHCDAPVIEGKPVRLHERAREERLVATPVLTVGRFPENAQAPKAAHYGSGIRVLGRRDLSHW